MSIVPPELHRDLDSVEARLPLKPATWLRIATILAATAASGLVIMGLNALTAGSATDVAAGAGDPTLWVSGVAALVAAVVPGAAFVGLVLYALVRRRAVIRVDALGVSLGRRRFPWTDIAACDLDGAHPRLVLQSGRVVRGPAVEPDPRISDALRDAAAALLALHRPRDPDPVDPQHDDAERRAREALAALRKAASGG